MSRGYRPIDFYAPPPPPPLPVHRVFARLPSARNVAMFEVSAATRRQAIDMVKAEGFPRALVLVTP